MNKKYYIYIVLILGSIFVLYGCPQTTKLDNPTTYTQPPQYVANSSKGSAEETFCNTKTTCNSQNMLDGETTLCSFRSGPTSGYATRLAFTFEGSEPIEREFPPGAHIFIIRFRKLHVVPHDNECRVGKVTATIRPDSSSMDISLPPSMRLIKSGFIDDTGNSATRSYRLYFDFQSVQSDNVRVAAEQLHSDETDQNLSVPNAASDQRHANGSIGKGTLDDPIIDSNVSWEEVMQSAVQRDIPQSIMSTQKLVDVKYYSFDGKIHQGQLVLDRRLVRDIKEIFEVARELEFPIQSVIPVSEFGWDDEQSMEANNTSSFNYRRTTSGKKLSNHAYGQAVDINPLYNPYISRSTVQPRGARYDTTRKGTFTANSPIVRAFAKRGWSWGGTWKHSKDYQHFEKRM